MRNESSEITSRAVAYGTAAGASSDRKDDASLPLVGDPPSVVNDSVVDNDGQQQQHEQCEHNNKPASSATEEESRVADETAVDVNSGGNGGGRRIEEVGNPSFVVKDQDGVVNHDGNTPQQRQRQYAKRNKQQPAASASKIVGGQRNLTIDHRRGYKYGVGPTNTSGTPRACTSARFSIEEEIDSAVFEYEAQKPWRDNERKLALEGLEATTSSLQQRHACSSASTSRHQRDRKSNSMVNLAEDTTETRPVAEQEEQLLLLLSGSNGKLPAAKDNITTGNASATIPSSSFREQHYLRQNSIDLPAAIDVTAEISTTITPSSGEEKPLRRDIIGLPPATDMTTGILNKTIPASSLREQHSLRQDIIRLAREDERETALLLSADAELKGAAQAGSRGDPAGAAYLLGAAGVNIIRRVELVDQLVVTASSLADTVESTLLLGAPLRTTTRTSQVHRWSNNTTTNKIFDSSRLQGNVEKKKEIGGGIQGRAERDGEDQARGWTREHKSGVGWPHAVQQDTTPLLWSLLIQRCRLPSLMPVAGLLHRLNSLCSLQIHGIVGRFTLNGLERLLSDAPCLRTIALRRCGLTRLPCLESASVETLDVGDNSIKTAAGLEHLFRLTVLNMSGNNICRLMDVLPLVPLGAGCLRVLNLNGNPVQNTLRYGTKPLFPHRWIIVRPTTLSATPTPIPCVGTLSPPKTIRRFCSRLFGRPHSNFFRANALGLLSRIKYGNREFGGECYWLNRKGSCRLEWNSARVVGQ